MTGVRNVISGVYHHYTFVTSSCTFSSHPQLVRVGGTAQVALPELDGGLEPIVFAGRDSQTGRSHSLPNRIDSLCSRAINWAK